MKKVISVILAALMIFSVGIIGASAAEEENTFSVFCYNVAGLPDISAITGGEKRDVPGNQAVIGKYVSENAFDIFATQEDFGYHNKLVANLSGYNYETQHHGIVPAGDGTNIFTRNMKLYNESHTPWNKLYGIIDDGADEFSQKGITYCVIEIAEGVYVDFYDIHADAYDDAGSREARADNFVQLAEMINSRSVDRAVIVTGDFNEYLLSPNTTIKTTLCDGCGLKDAWIELYNEGNYESEAPYRASLNGADPGAKWGRWDAVERFLYKSGEGVTLECSEYELINVYNELGQNCSDHAAARAVFTYTTDGSEVTISDLSVYKGNSITEFIRRVVIFFKALRLAFSNLDKLQDYLNK